MNSPVSAIFSSLTSGSSLLMVCRLLNLPLTLVIIPMFYSFVSFLYIENTSKLSINTQPATTGHHLSQNALGTKNISLYYYFWPPSHLRASVETAEAGLFGKVKRKSRNTRRDTRYSYLRLFYFQQPPTTSCYCFVFNRERSTRGREFFDHNHKIEERGGEGNCC